MCFPSIYIFQRSFNLSLFNMLKSEPNSVGPDIPHQPRRTLWNLELFYCGPHMSISRDKSQLTLLKKKKIGVQLSYNVLVSSIQQSESVLHICISVLLFRSFSCAGTLSRVPGATQWVLIGYLLSYVVCLWQSQSPKVSLLLLILW